MTNRAGHFTLDAHASRPVACLTWLLTWIFFSTPGPGSQGLNLLWPSGGKWRHISGSTLAQVMVCCLTAPSHYLDHCCLIIISDVLWQSPEGNITWKVQRSLMWVWKITNLILQLQLPGVDELTTGRCGQNPLASVSPQPLTPYTPNHTPHNVHKYWSIVQCRPTITPPYRLRYGTATCHGHAHTTSAMTS